MKFLDGPIGLIAGFIGIGGMFIAYTNYTLDPVAFIFFGVLILAGIITVYRRMTGKDKESDSGGKGPLSPRSKSRRK